jgi:hypothetical protein
MDFTDLLMFTFFIVSIVIFLAKMYNLLTRIKFMDRKWIMVTEVVSFFCWLIIFTVTSINLTQIIALINISGLSSFSSIATTDTFLLNIENYILVFTFFLFLIEVMMFVSIESIESNKKNYRDRMQGRMR